MILAATVVAEFCRAAEPSPHFPIGVWLQNPANAPRFRAAGINTFVGLWQGPTEAQLDALKAAAGEPLTAQMLADVTGHPYPATRKLLFRMSHDGELVRNKRGSYQLPE